MHKKGFTLAEVLVTLAIVGVLASMTIPTMLQNLNNAQYKGSLKKVYTDLSQATLMVQNNGDDGFTASSDNNAMRNSYGTYMNFIKTGLISNIFTNYQTYKLYGSSTIQSIWTPAELVPSAILNNGTLIYFEDYSSSDCGMTQTSLQNICGQFAVDINGDKAPNMYGKDFYLFWLTKNNGSLTVVPRGANGDGRSCTSGSASTTTSEGCTYNMLYNETMP